MPPTVIKTILRRGLGVAAGVYKRSGIAWITKKAGVQGHVLQTYGRLQSFLLPDEHEIRVNDSTISIGVESGETARHVDITDELEFVSTFHSTVSENDTVFDIGAHIGIYSCLAAAKGGEVVAVEPHPKNIPQIKKNLRRNGLSAIVKEAALSDKSGTIEFDLGTDESGGVGRLAESDDQANVVSVDVLRGDELAVELGIKPELVKIDVEGAEALALRGLEGVLESVRTGFIEIHPDLMKDYDTEPADVHTLLTKNGFEISEIGEKAGGKQLLMFTKKCV